MARVAQAVRQAAELLKEAGVTGPPVDVHALARRKGAEVRKTVLDEGVSGMLARNRSGDVLIAVNSAHHPHRQRFTVAHELGHLLLHATEPAVFVDDVMIYFRDDGSSPMDPREVEANSFAAALLMPEAMLRADLHERAVDVADDEAVEALRNRYRVSAQALTIRLVELGLVRGLRSSGRGR